MILFVLLLAVLMILMICVALAGALGVTAFVVLFGDVIVCVAIIVFIIKYLIGKKRRRP